MCLSAVSPSGDEQEEQDENDGHHNFEDNAADSSSCWAESAFAESAVYATTQTQVATGDSQSQLGSPPSMLISDNLPPSILVLGYHVGVLSLQSAKTSAPLCSQPTVSKIKKAVAAHFHPDKGRPSNPTMYQIFNAKCDDLLKPSYDTESWKMFNQVIDSEVKEAQSFLSGRE